MSLARCYIVAFSNKSKQNSERTACLCFEGRWYFELYSAFICVVFEVFSLGSTCEAKLFYFYFYALYFRLYYCVRIDYIPGTYILRYMLTTVTSVILNKSWLHLKEGV